MKRKNLLIILITIICFVMNLLCFGVIQQGGLYANQNQENITRNVESEVKSDVNVGEDVKVSSTPNLTRNIDGDNFPKDPWCCWRLVNGVWVCGPCS
jgi:hypothetical protein